MRRWIEVGCLAAGLWLAVAACEAAAGTYDVHGCRLPGGQPISADGWQPYVGGANALANNGCAGLGGLEGWFSASASVMSEAVAGWVFDAPADTTIDNYLLHRTSRVAPAPGAYPYGRDAWLYHDAPRWEGMANSQYVANFCLHLTGCTGQGNPDVPLAPANRYERSGVRVLRLFLVSQCLAPVGCAPTAASNVIIWASRIGLSDPHSPTFRSGPAGTALQAGAVVDGERPVHFTAEDRGGGIATVALVVDGQAFDEQPALPTATACTRPYTTPVPCPLVLERTMALDTTRISNGTHVIQVMLIDAAGNRTLSHPTQVVVRNRGVPNGVGASQFARLDAWFASRGTSRRTAAVVSYGRTRTITGRLLTPEGTPIVGAALDVSATTGRPGSRGRVIGQVATDGNGAFSYTPKAASSRKVSVSYRAYTLDAAASAVSDVVLQTRAGIKFAVSPRRVGARGVIRFQGQLRGGPGRAGTQVTIYALAGPRSRIPVATVRADSSGRFRYRYRFSNSAPGTTYRFRATVHAQRSYPYATGHSPRATVRISRR